MSHYSLFVSPRSSSARLWEKEAEYGRVFFRRATGKAPEMECSKAAAKQLIDVLKPGMRVLDVGCGAGHYLVSLRKQFPFPFFYQGVDVTPYYIELAQKAFNKDPQAVFRIADIHKLPFPAKEFDIVLCCNVLLHLPFIASPMRELWRVTGKTLLVRTLVGNQTFLIRHVQEPADAAAWKAVRDPVFDAQHEPRRFYHFNIYSKPYIERLCSKYSGLDKLSIAPDLDFSPQALSAKTWPSGKKPPNITNVINGLQVNGYIVQPWAFIRADRRL